uniref:Uncharacterized protein n=1 Tax=Pithovirus LCDPAC02 TaxID=2506601 RepID=A0A481YPE4_9VIRU|nr:MAG: hypothetical protein LCDPAC02_00360 [Pithovirus LCDPAC02]
MDNNINIIKSMYIIAIILWIAFAYALMPYYIFINPISLLIIVVVSSVLLINAVFISTENEDYINIRKTKFEFLIFVIITIIVAIYRFSKMKGEIFNKIIIGVVIALTLFFIPIINVPIKNNIKNHLDNILIILALGILLYIIASTAAIKCKCQNMLEKKEFKI